MMLDVEVIKWGCGFADGFDFEKLPFGSDYFIIYSSRNYYKSDEIWEDVIYPLFLQRVIEGINNLHLNNDMFPIITIDHAMINVWRVKKDINMFWELEEFDNIDQAKEQAIKYIWEHTNETIN